MFSVCVRKTIIVTQWFCDVVHNFYRQRLRKNRMTLKPNTLSMIKLLVRNNIHCGVAYNRLAYHTRSTIFSLCSIGRLHLTVHDLWYPILCLSCLEYSVDIYKKIKFYIFSNILCLDPMCGTIVTTHICNVKTVPLS